MAVTPLLGKVILRGQGFITPFLTVKVSKLLKHLNVSVGVANPDQLQSLCLFNFKLSAGRSWNQNSRVLIRTLDGVFKHIQNVLIGACKSRPASFFLPSKLVSFDSTSFSKRDGVYNPVSNVWYRNYLWKICDDLFYIATLVRNQTFRLGLQNLFGKVLKTEVKIQKQSFII